LLQGATSDYLYIGFDISLTPIWMHDHLGTAVTVIGFAYMMWAIPSIITDEAGQKLNECYDSFWQ